MSTPFSPFFWVSFGSSKKLRRKHGARSEISVDQQPPMENKPRRDGIDRAASCFALLKRVMRKADLRRFNDFVIIFSSNPRQSS
jgi:hypothetical protein